MGKWTESTLHEKIFVKHGFPFKSEYFAETGDYILLTPGNFFEEGGFKRQPGKEKFYDGPIPKEYVHNKGDLIVAMTEQAEGLLGSCAIVPEDNLYLHNQRLGLITSKNSEVDELFIYHLFKSKRIRKQLRITSTGSKVKHTSPERIYDLKVNLPPIDSQIRISKFLSDLDTKIELNNKINAELEAMAKLIYDYWFVQFDFPDANGKPYKSSGGKMVYNEDLKREIPDGWEVKQLSDIANITMGQSPPGSSYNDDKEGVVFFQGSTDFGWRFPITRQYTTEPSRLAKIGDILLSVRAPVGTLNIADNNCCVGRGLAALNSKDNATSYLFYVMVYFKQIFDRRNSAGTTFGAITKDDLYSLKLVHPTENILKEYDDKVVGFNMKIFNNHNQNQKLAELRDWLLPMLMNGQVTVKEAEEKSKQANT